MLGDECPRHFGPICVSVNGNTILFNVFSIEKTTAKDMVQSLLTTPLLHADLRPRPSQSNHPSLTKPPVPF